MMYIPLGAILDLPSLAYHPPSDFEVPCVSPLLLADKSPSLNTNAVVHQWLRRPQGSRPPMELAAIRRNVADISELEPFGGSGWYQEDPWQAPLNSKEDNQLDIMMEV